MELVLETKELTKIYSKRSVVDKVSMKVSKGDIYGFIGRNGAGKTTTMRLVLGMIFPNSGEVEIFGKPACDESRAKIGSLIEAPGLYKKCTAYENLRRFSLLFGGDDKKIKQILELVQLQDTGKKKAGAFSLGMRQRLGIGIALLGDPDFLVLDEPVNGLDPAGIKDVRDTILNINKEKNVTILISSHLLGELAKISTRYGIINNGALIEEFSADELYDKCRKTLNIVTDDTDKAAKIISDKYSITPEKKDNSKISLYDGFDKAPEMLSDLVMGGCRIHDFHIESADMEDYFIERIGK